MRSKGFAVLRCTPASAPVTAELGVLVRAWISVSSVNSFLITRNRLFQETTCVKSRSNSAACSRWVRLVVRAIRRHRLRTRPRQTYLRACGESDVEAELDDVAVLHDVVLAFHADLAGGAGGGHGAGVD